MTDQERNSETIRRIAAENRDHNEDAQLALDLALTGETLGIAAARMWLKTCAPTSNADPNLIQRIKETIS